MLFNFHQKTTTSDLLDELERFIIYWLGPYKKEYGESLEVLNHEPIPLLSKQIKIEDDLFYNKKKLSQGNLKN